jgi:hypothetical protein
MQQLNLKIPTNLWRVLELHAQHTTQQPEQVVITPLPSTYKALTARYIKSRSRRLLSTVSQMEQ